MKIEVGKFYKTRDGREVRIYAVDGSYGRCIHGATKDWNTTWTISTWTFNGSWNENCLTSDKDIISEWNEPTNIKLDAIELAKYYLKLHTFESEYHGDIVMPEGQMAREFLERWEK